MAFHRLKIFLVNLHQFFSSVVGEEIVEKGIIIIANVYHLYFFKLILALLKGAFTFKIALIERKYIVIWFNKIRYFLAQN